MIPLRDELQAERLPVVTLAIIAINIVIFLAGLAPSATLTAGTTPASRHDVWVYEYGTIPCELFAKCDNQPGEVSLTPRWWETKPQTVTIAVPEHPALLTLLTSTFLHGSVAHLAFNMLFFWVYGNNVEDSMGRPMFLGFFLAGGVVAALAQSFVDPGGTIPQIGASGAIAATIGGYVMLYPRARILTMIFLPFFLHLPAWLVAGLWAIGQAVATAQSVFTPTASAHGGVAYMAHFAGFAFGLLVIKQIAEPTPQYREWYPPLRGG